RAVAERLAVRSHPRPILEKRLDLHGSRIHALALDEADDALDGVEVGRDHLLILDIDLEALLEKRHHLEHAGRVDDTTRDQRFCRRRRGYFLTKEELLDDELANQRFRALTHGATPPCWWMSCSTTSWVERMPTSAIPFFAPPSAPRRAWATSRATARASNRPQ